VEKLRDLLIIIVCSGLIVWWGVAFVTRWNQLALEDNPVIQQAEDDCHLEGMTCQFTTVQSAEAYLKHARESRDGMQRLKEAYLSCMKKAITPKQQQECAPLNMESR
jgi:hypothetical protein